MYKQEIPLAGKRNPSKLQKAKSEGNKSITEQSTETSFFFNSVDLPCLTVTAYCIKLMLNIYINASAA